MTVSALKIILNLSSGKKCWNKMSENILNCHFYTGEGRCKDSWLQLIKLTDAEAHFRDAKYYLSIYEVKMTPFSCLVITALIPSSIIISSIMQQKPR